MFFDIFVMWIALYYTIRLVRNNQRTIQIFKGVLLVLMIDTIAKLVGLKTVEYVTNIFINWGFLAVFIIFQQEIRSLLERIGKSNVFSKITTLTGNEKENLVDQIVTAAMLLSKDQTGALISIEQSFSLEDYISTGTKLNSVVSAELLTSLFVTSTPLHDGAVIIQGDRIACASAYFPPTTLDLPSRYGARHRAAIGISEITDAVTVVVSEETGAISITEGGKIFSVDSKGLRDYLMRVICGEETEVRSGGGVVEPARDVVIEDKRTSNGDTGVLNKLAIKKQEAERPSAKIETEEVIPAENTVSEEPEVVIEDSPKKRHFGLFSHRREPEKKDVIKELEHGADDIKLPRKKERPAPSYPGKPSSIIDDSVKTEMEEIVSRQKEEQRLAEQRRLEEEQRIAEQQRLEEERRQAEQRRLEQEQYLLEQRRQEEELRRERERTFSGVVNTEYVEPAEQEQSVQPQRMSAEEVRLAREASMRRLQKRDEPKPEAQPQPETPSQPESAPQPEPATQPKPEEPKIYDTTNLDISGIVGLNQDLEQTLSMVDLLETTKKAADRGGKQ
ncbi:MAG: diadenylate cyclase CdaA [Solobacterium sp.]|nr:diadenylate cyclase CdaA [Solobacterium sp.]